MADIQPGIGPFLGLFLLAHGVTARRSFADMPLADQRPVVLLLGEGSGGTLDALPTPLGSLMELLLPPTLPGPDGMPLTPVVPAPADPAFGVPAGLLVAGAPAAGAAP